MKAKIARGEFTPCVTNSWANSKVNLKEFGIPFRSTWEAYFYLFMTIKKHNLKYEKLRIQYYDPAKNKMRNYITDFVDYENQMVYEIKPNGYKDNITIIAKEKAAQHWCMANDYTFKYISEDWFYENYDETLLTNFEHTEKIKKALMQFKGKHD